MTQCARVRACVCPCRVDKYERKHHNQPGTRAALRRPSRAICSASAGPHLRVSSPMTAVGRQTSNLTPHSYLSVRLNLRAKKKTKKERHTFRLSLRLCGLVKGSASVTRSRRQRRCLSLSHTKGLRASHKPDRCLTPLETTHPPRRTHKHGVKELHGSSQSKPTWTSTSVNTHPHASS